MYATSRASIQSRPSHTAAHSLKLRERLRRTGAMASSCSALSRHDATSEDFLVVDVGEGCTPTDNEQLIARFEQHGMRRCFFRDSDVSDYTMAPCVDVRQDVTSDECTSVLATNEHDPSCNSTHAESRSPYYYLCVPCEQRLTNISTTPATAAMLQDLQYHFASAAHREAASWMADPDIEETLSTAPCIQDPHAYTRIYLNGVPLLLSRRPGGGDMFYPLPHEVERVSSLTVVRRASVLEEPTLTSAAAAAVPASLRPDRGLLFPSPRYSSDANYWYRPLTAVYTRSKQLVSLPGGRGRPGGSRLGQAAVRRAVVVRHVPVREYLRYTQLEKDLATVHPCIYALERRMLPKALLDRKRSRDGDDYNTIGHPADAQSSVRRCYYVQPSQPYVTRYTGECPTAGIPLTPLEDRCLVEANGVYRVCVRSARSAAAAQPPPTRANDEHKDAPPTLTRELLAQVTGSTPFRACRTTATSAGSLGQNASSHGGRSFSSYPSCSGSAHSDAGVEEEPVAAADASSLPSSSSSEVIGSDSRGDCDSSSSLS